MSEVIERVIDVSIEQPYTPKVEITKSREGTRSLDIEITVYGDDNVSIVQTYIEKNIDIVFNSTDIAVELARYGGASKQMSAFIDRFIRGDKGDNSVKRLTQEEYDLLLQTEQLDLSYWYFVTNQYNSLKKIYAGERLIAQSNEEGTFAFPYTFPITF